MLIHLLLLNARIKMIFISSENLLIKYKLEHYQYPHHLQLFVVENHYHLLVLKKLYLIDYIIEIIALITPESHYCLSIFFFKKKYVNRISDRLSQAETEREKRDNTIIITSNSQLVWWQYLLSANQVFLMPFYLYRCRSQMENISAFVTN